MHGHRVIVISIDGFAAFYWSDPQARVPTLRHLAERGAVASGVETVFPSTTWPTHVSLMTGVSPRAHGVVANHVLNRRTGAPEDLTGDPVYDAPDLLRVPTVYDRAHDAGLRTAAIDWPATRHTSSAVTSPICCCSISCAWTACSICTDRAPPRPTGPSNTWTA